MKCYRCDTVKDESLFYKNDRTCKECRKRINKEHRKNNVEYYRKYDRDRSRDPKRVMARKEYWDKLKRDGKFSQVRYKATKKYREKNPDKYKAVSIVNKGIRNGNIKKLPCSICGDPVTEAHHDDYNLPYNIIWLCGKHHRERHNMIRENKRHEKRIFHENN